jgi:prophage regulatory protein
MVINIQRISTIQKQLGISRSTCYNLIALGLLPKPIRVGPRAVGWPSSEIETILIARIAGKSDEEIMQIVSQIECKRKG